MPARRLLCVSLEGRTSDALHRFKNLCSVLYSQGYTRRHPGSRRADNCSRDTSAMTSLSLWCTGRQKVTVPRLTQTLLRGSGLRSGIQPQSLWGIIH